MQVLLICIMALLADGRTFKYDKRVYEKRMLGMEVPELIYVPRIELHCAVSLLGLLHRGLRVAYSLRSRRHDGSNSWFPRHARWTNAADEWARPPLAVSWTSGGLDGEEAGRPIMPRMILGVGFKLPLQLPQGYKRQGARC
jgi:hypothetical protein